ncbi:hypothetical protein ACHAW5_011250 [Stephanodiscus triporus]|uniref:Endopeptidase S2P n=1 Tax=Stephanodiscus triporus TaxID=2934178 RepID=A0ABD3PPV9_9STRA
MLSPVAPFSLLFLLAAAASTPPPPPRALAYDRSRARRRGRGHRVVAFVGPRRGDNNSASQSSSSSLSSSFAGAAASASASAATASRGVGPRGRGGGRSTTPLFSAAAATGDDDDYDEDVVAEEEARRLRERAGTLRLEASIAERALLDDRRRRKEERDAEADRLIDSLSMSSSSSLSASSSDVAGMGDPTSPPPPLPTARDLADRMRDGRTSLEALVRVVERLHERETSAAVGLGGYLSRDTEGGDFVLGDYENNSVERRRIESERISGLLDRILEAARMIEEEGGSSTSMTADRRLTSSDDGIRRKSTDGSSLASTLRARASDLRRGRDATFRRRVNSLLVKNDPGVVASVDRKNGREEKGAIESYVRRSIDGNSHIDDDQIGGDDDDEEERRKRRIEEGERTMKRLIETPPWLPQYLAEFAVTSTVDVPVSHWKTIRTELLADSGFVCTSWDFTEAAAVFRGKLSSPPLPPPGVELRKDGGSVIGGGMYVDDDGGRPVEDRSIAATFERLQDRVRKHAQLKDSIQLFLIDDNEWRPSFDKFPIGGAVGNHDNRIDGRRPRDVSERERPPSVIIALARDVSPERGSQGRGLATRSLAVISTLLTLFTSLVYALGAYSLNPSFFHSIVRENDVTAVPMCLPIFVGVLAMSAVHELGHIIAAGRHGVKLGVPVPLPSLQVGTFGSITPLRSFPPTRVALFDFLPP